MLPARSYQVEDLNDHAQSKEDDSVPPNDCDQVRLATLSPHSDDLVQGEDESDRVVDHGSDEPDPHLLNVTGNAGAEAGWQLEVRIVSGVPYLDRELDGEHAAFER